MTINEIKKVLYKERPMATLIEDKTISGKLEKIFLYEAECSLGKVSFQVPTDEMGETTFEDKIPAQLLIRWLTKRLDEENVSAKTKTK